MIEETTMAKPVRLSRPRMPDWLKRPIGCAGKKKTIEGRIAESRLHTVCVEAKCPNRGECFGKGTATFLILGAACTRSCAFCGVGKGLVGGVDAQEPDRVCDAVKTMGLSHVVITSVTRDDLADGGASIFARTVAALKKNIRGITVEVLVPDFKGMRSAVETVLMSGPDVFNHNVETVPRLYAAIRPQAVYSRSLEVLAQAAGFGVRLGIKSGLMVGLGETHEEVYGTLADLRRAGCTMITIGQYLQPSSFQTPVREFVTPRQFKQYESVGLELGFSRVFAGTYVRSSYRAEEIINKNGLKPATGNFLNF
jgi:lipoic acid synthetase